jgi:hypothetical protein
MTRQDLRLFFPVRRIVGLPRRRPAAICRGGRKPRFDKALGFVTHLEDNRPAG